MRSLDFDREGRTEWQPVKLQGEEGRLIYIEAISHGGREEVGLLQTVAFDQITDVFEGIARGIGDALEKAKPKKASVELGVEFGLEAGKLIAMIARGSGKANIKIRLEWEGL
jgi:hypothetical protein